MIAYSRAGYGNSEPCKLPRPLDYMEREADLLEDVVNALKLDSYVLLGHSDGGSIAALAAGCEQSRLRGLILLAPHFFVEDISLRAIRAATEVYASGELHDRLQRYHADPDIAFHGWSGTWLDPGFREWDITNVIPNWQCPVLAIQGTEDPYGTAAQIEVIERAAAQAETHLLPACGHAPHLETSDQVLGLITTFVGGLSP